MVLPILVPQELELVPVYVPAQRKLAAVARPIACSRDDLIYQWRRVLALPAPASSERRCKSLVLPARAHEMTADGDSSELLHDTERLARLLLRRSWSRLPRRQRSLLRREMRAFDPEKPVIRIPQTQINATAWLLAAMHWNGCRHPGAIWCKPLHPATGVVRWLSGFDVVEQNEHARDIMAQLFARVGWLELQSRRLVKSMRARKRGSIALLPELLR